MTPRLRWLLGIAAALAVSCAAVLIVQANSRPKPPAPSPAAAERASKHSRPTTGPSREIVLTLLVPAEGEPLSEAASGHGPTCPQSQVSALLGLEITTPHGISVGKVFANTPGETAGLVSGDSIVKCNGHPVDCPRTLLPYLDQGKERKPVELTVRRAVADAQDAGTGAKQATQSEAGSPAGSAR